MLRHPRDPLGSPCGLLTACMQYRGRKDVLDVVGRTQRGEGSGRREMGWRTLLQHRLSQWLSMASVVSVVWAETHMLLGGMR